MIWRIFLLLTYFFVSSRSQSLHIKDFRRGAKLLTLSEQNDTRKFLNIHPDVGLTAPQLITKYGYPVETHTVETKDFYVLTLHRIPYGPNNKNIKNKPVVFLMHGLLSSSADWVLMGPSQGLAYLLADLGYDVWMGNARGNIYSRKNVYLDPSDHAEAFWDFSWHEIGVIDLPTMIDYILDETENHAIYYIGHSQGCTTFFAMTSTLPEYNEKIKLMVALAPAVFMANTPSPFFSFAIHLTRITDFLISFLGGYELIATNNFLRTLSGYLCDSTSIVSGICKNIVFLLYGFDEAQLNRTMLPVMLSHIPAGSSTKQLIHFIQNGRSHKFRKFDHGFIKNILRYGSTSPPEYDLSEVTAPVAIFFGENDLLVSTKDVETLHKNLPNVIYFSKVPFKEFTHLDFLWAIDVVDLLYNDIFELLLNFQ